MAVVATIDLAEDPERRRRMDVVGETGQREGEARIVTVRVVDEQRLDADVGEMRDVD